MPIIYEEMLKKDLGNERLSSVYVIFGDDSYLKKFWVTKIVSASCDKDDIFNYQRFENNCNLQDVYDAACQFPVMADRKCVVLYDYNIEKADKSDMSKLEELITGGFDTTVFILWFDTWEFDSKKSPKAKKIIKAAEKAGGKVVMLNHKSVSELIKTVTAGALKRGSKIEASVAKYLIESVGNDISILQNELNKLCAYCGERTVTKENVDEVCIKSVEVNVYNLTKEIIMCNISGAMKILDSLFFARLEPMIILYTISGFYVDIYRVFAGKKAGVKTSEIADDFGYKGREFVLNRAGENLRRIDDKRIMLSFDAILTADKSLKSFGGDERIILEQLIIRLIYIISKGESID